MVVCLKNSKNFKKKSNVIFGKIMFIEKVFLDFLNE